MHLRQCITLEEAVVKINQSQNGMHERLAVQRIEMLYGITKEPTYAVCKEVDLHSTIVERFPSGL